jgi:sRNA-binding protein
MKPHDHFQVLAERFPVFRHVTGQPDKPLKIGIFDDIMALGLMDEKTLRGVLCWWTRRLKYQCALRSGGPRFDLNGEPCGEVTAEQQQESRVRASEIHGRLKTKRDHSTTAPPRGKGLSLADLKRAAQERKASVSAWQGSRPNGSGT